jgi:polar amino acid transport system substrate-binding protein
MRGWSSIVAALSWCLLAGAPPAAAAAVCQRPLRVAFFDFGAMSFVDGDGTVRGVDKDLVDVIGRRTGCRFEARMQDRAETWRALAAGQIDLALSAIATPERATFAVFVPYIVTRNLVIVRRELAGRLHRPDDLADDPALRLGVVAGFRHGTLYDPVVERVRSAGRLHEYPDTDGLFGALRAGAIDALFSNPAVFPRKLRQVGMEFRIEVVDFPSPDAPIEGAVAIGTARTSAAERDALAAAVRQTIADGTLRAILTDHLGQLYAKWITIPPP